MEPELKPEQELTLLHQIELEVLAEGQEFMKQRLRKKLQRLADARGEVSPPQRAAADPPAAEPGGAVQRGRAC